MTTWGLAEDPRRRADELAALRQGLDAGMTLVDTAEMYAGGAAEELVGEAITGRRDEVFLVGKVFPAHASREGTVIACQRSLRRLGTDRFDLYLLHWRGHVPLQETVDAFMALRTAGSIRAWGVGNFDVPDLAELLTLVRGGDVATDQVPYNPARRSIELDVLPWCVERRLAVMTYAPFDGGPLLDHPVLGTIARRHGATPAQVVLAWILRHERLAVLPMMRTPAEVRENAEALGVRLAPDDLLAMDDAFPRPRAPEPIVVA